MTQSRRVLTADEVEQTKMGRIQWGGALANALKNWCDNNGYHPRKNLGKELAIPSQAWDDLFDPRGGVCGDISVYARVHVRTGLREANPCTIPSRVRVAPKIPGRYYEIVRAWTDEEYKRWREGYKSQQPLAESPKEIPEPMVTLAPPQERVRSQTKGWGAALEETVQTLLALLPILQELVPAIQGLTKKLDERGKGVDGALTVKTAVEFLYDALHEAAEGTSADRDAFYREHGENLLCILPLLSALTKDRGKREIEIEMMKTMEGIAR